MVVVQIDLGLTAIEQLPGLCGPACAQMILHPQPNPGIGTSEKEQRELWQDIKANTTVPAGIQQPPRTPDTGDCGDFPRKVCECPANPFCWCTFPTALKATLLQHSPQMNVRVITSVSETSIQAKIIKCLKRGSAPAVLVFKAKHWVVVGGYDSHSETPIKLFDPRFNARQEITLDDWVTNYLVAPTCGKYSGKHVVIGADA
jgi:hypothetical protein